MKNQRYLKFVWVCLLLTGCSAAGFSAGTSTPTPSDTPAPSATTLPTNTLEPTATFTAAPSPLPTIMPTIEPLFAIAKTSVTFRSGPSKGSDNVGGVYGNQAVQVIARNIAATWFYIIAPEAPGGTAWVLASGFNLQGDLTQLPIAVFPPDSKTPVLLPPLLYTVVGTPLPLNPPAPGARTAKLNLLGKVRVGPGLGYMELGLLDPGTVVVVTGRTKGNAWYQIEYPSGLEGHGWILGELVKFEGDPAGLPFFNALATPVDKEDSAPIVAAVVTETPAGAPLTTPVPVSPTADLPYGITLAQINARSGPASSYAAYGLIEKDQRVNLLGQTVNGLWLQIEYPAAPTGVAWVSSQYVKLMSNIQALPYFDDSGTLIPKP